MALTLNPLSNPDDIRAEASKVPTHAGKTAVESAAPETTGTPLTTQVASLAATPAAPTEQASAATEPTVAAASTAEQAPEWQPYQTLTSAAPASSAMAAPSPANFTQTDVSMGGYTYMVPAGIYAIVALSSAAALLFWVVIIFFNAHRFIPIVEALVITVFGIGLISRNAIIRYGAIAASGIGAAYMAYQSLRLIQFASSSGGALFSSFGYAGSLVGIAVIYLAITIALGVCCGYLLSSRVGRAFK